MMLVDSIPNPGDILSLEQDYPAIDLMSRSGLASVGEMMGVRLAWPSAFQYATDGPPVYSPIDGEKRCSTESWPRGRLHLRVWATLNANRGCELIGSCIFTN